MCFLRTNLSLAIVINNFCCEKKRTSSSDLISSLSARKHRQTSVCTTSARHGIRNPCQKTEKYSCLKFKDCLRENQIYAIKLAFWQEILSKRITLYDFSSFLWCTPWGKTVDCYRRYISTTLRNEQPSNDVSILFHSRNFESLIRRLIFYTV